MTYRKSIPYRYVPSFKNMANAWRETNVSSDMWRWMLVLWYVQVSLCWAFVTRNSVSCNMSVLVVMAGSHCYQQYDNNNHWQYPSDPRYNCYYFYYSNLFSIALFMQITITTIKWSTPIQACSHSVAIRNSVMVICMHNVVVHQKPRDNIMIIMDSAHCYH